MRIQLTVRVEEPGVGVGVGVGVGAEDAAPGDRQMVVECAPGVRAGALTAALAEGLGLAAGGPESLVVEGCVVPSHATVGRPPLLTGAVVEVRTGRSADPGPHGRRAAIGRWELRVESGPDVGRRFVLPAVPVVLGRDRRSALSLTDPRVSRRHAELMPSAAGVLVRDLGGANGTSVGGRPVGSGSLLVTPGEELRLGSTSMSLHPLVREAAHLSGDGEGGLLMDPVVAAPAPPPPEAVTLPEPPPDRERPRFPWLALLVPVVLAGVLALVMRSPTMLLFGLGGPVLSFGTWVTTRRGFGRRTRDEQSLAIAARRAAEDGVELARAAERAGLMNGHPSLATLLAGAETRSRDLWARPADRAAPGPLHVRLGVGSPPSRLQVIGEPAPSLLTDAPVTVDLAETDLVTFLGSRTMALRAATNLVSRLAAQHGPRRVEVCVLVGGAQYAADWSFARLLPQVLEVTSAPVLGMTGPTSLPAGSDGGHGVGWVGERDPPAPATRRVVVLDGGPALLRTSAARHVLSLASDSRITVVALGDVPGSEVATGRTAAVTLESAASAASAAVVVGGRPPVPFVPDLPGDAYAWQLARALAPLRDVDGGPARSGIPARARLLDLLPLDGEGSAPASATLGRHLVQSWKEHPRSTRAVLGVTHQGRFALDLDTDGPHALVGGTTGSGKSELLQTLVTSLALANRPDEMTFVLVDYKGGAAFRGCAELPHVVGWVTDLDAHLTRRALLSLGAEVRRRERILAAAGVPDLAAHQARCDLGRADEIRTAVPRLVIVIDEFRVLAEELPDFVPALVRLAAVGRSLGIHLVLATQRPGGIVTADIRANVSLRIALRVRDRTDSMDVIERPDAAAVSAETPGRAFLVGAGTALTELQTAQVTSGPATTSRLVVTDVTRWWERRAGAAATGPAAGSDQPADPGPNPHRQRQRQDLDDIVAATWAAARELGAARAPAPWLPPLPDTLALTDLAAPDGTVPVGLVDLPDQQMQESWCWRMDGHLGIAGGPGSGRTTAVRTIAGALASTWPPTGVHLYVLGPPTLATLAELPHTAAVAGLHDADHAALVVERLTAVVQSRIRGDSQARQPRVVVLVDGWELVAGLAGGSVGHELRAVLEVGRTVGVVAVVTGGRAVLSGQLAALFSSRLVLRVADPVELALAGVPAKSVPLHQPPGRALVVGSHQEIQLALLGGSSDEVVQDASLAAVARRWTAHPAEGERGTLPRPVHRLPTRISVTEVEPASDGVVLGVREGDLRPVHLSLARGHRRLVVIGPPGSGRTTALVTLAHGLLGGGGPVAVVGRDLTTELSRSRHGLGSTLALTGTDAEDVGRLVAFRRAQPSLRVLVDDVEGFPALDAVLREVARLVDDDSGLLVVATTPAVVDARASPVVRDLERVGAGLLLRPRPGSHQLGVVIPPRAAAQPDPPGRGLLVRQQQLERIQVAVP